MAVLERPSLKAKGSLKNTTKTTAALDKNIDSVNTELFSDESVKLLKDRESIESIVRTIARKANNAQTRLTGGNTLETMAQLRQDSLLSQPLIDPTGATKISDNGMTIKKALDEIDIGSISDIFSTEKNRTDDYVTFAQIYELITQAAECVHSYCDNIISPDDFTKRDIAVFYEAPSASDEALKIVKERTHDLIERYELEERCETAIIQSLLKGDFFMGVLNLRQELQGLLHEDTAHEKPPVLFESAHIPSTSDDDLKALIEMVKQEDPKTPFNDSGDMRNELAQYFNSFVQFNEDASGISAKSIESMSWLNDINSKGKRTKAGSTEKDKPSLANSELKGSIIKMVHPENVVKLYQDDALFGYFFIEFSGPDISELTRRGTGTMDQTTLVRAIDQNLSSRSLGSQNVSQLKGKDALISRIFVKTLAAKFGNSKFLADNEEYAHDAYNILTRAKRENRRAVFTYLAPDQVVHFTPDGSHGYGTSVLAKVKFLSKLYIGAMTNAFMRNSIRRPERLVWYIDCGVDNDGSNAVQNFIRTIKQREVKFSNLRDITTTINQIGEFHDFYVPTYNGERPVEVETINMGGASEVDSPFLEFLRKAIIAGMGVPAAFLGYSEEVAFARSLSMDNGRFLRRVIRHQKHYGKAVSRLIRLLWNNEFKNLEELIGNTSAKDDKKSETKPKKVPIKPLTSKSDKDTDSLNIEADRLVVRYPSPATLNMTGMADIINQAEPVVEFVSTTVIGGKHANNDALKSELRKSIIKDLMPQVQWEKYENYMNEILIATARDGVGSNTSSGSESSSSSSSF